MVVLATMSAAVAAIVPIQEVDTKPDWAETPNAAAIDASLPAELRWSGPGGKAVVDCLIPPSGVPEDCVLVSEDPSGAGYGDVLLKIAPTHFRMRPATKGGASVATRIKIPMQFQVPDPLDDLRLKPKWLETPTREQVSSAWPEAAVASAAKGSATLECTLKLDTRLHDCRVLSETPVGYGFGAAALSLAPLYRAKPPLWDGKPAEHSRTFFEIRFRQPK